MPTAPSTAIIDAMRVFHPGASQDTLLDAWKAIIERSTLAGCTTPPLTDEDTRTIAEYVLEYITGAFSYKESREFRLEAPNSQFGTVIEFGQFAEEYSMDFLNEAISGLGEGGQFDRGLSAESLSCAFAAILYRYRYCVLTDLRVFPVSYVQLLAGLVARFCGKDRELPTITYKIVLALAACERNA